MEVVSATCEKTREGKGRTEPDARENINTLMKECVKCRANGNLA